MRYKVILVNGKRREIFKRNLSKQDAIHLAKGMSHGPVHCEVKDNRGNVVFTTKAP